VHDRLWHAQLCELLRRRGHPFVDREIVRWGFSQGPILTESQSDPGSPLRSAVVRGDAPTVCSHAGRLLEAICDRLSWTFPISIERKRGDRYTLGDLWPGISKRLRKSNIGAVSAEVDKWVHLRNLLGAHYNEWAQGVSLQEVMSFGDAVLNLLDRVRCTKCWRWIEPVSDRPQRWVCRCGAVAVECG
jgi:hypothetical protein